MFNVQSSSSASNAAILSLASSAAFLLFLVGCWLAFA
jgi:hypothetical protein